MIEPERSTSANADVAPSGLASAHDSPSRSLKIALMIESDGPGGAEQMLLHLGETLRDRGHEVIPLLPAEGYGWLPERFLELGIAPEHYALRSPLDPVCLARMVALLRRRRIDVVHSHEFSMAIYGTAATSLLGRPHVITLHGGLYFEEKRRRRMALRWACRRSRFVVTVSEASQDRYARSLDLAPDDLGVVPNGVPVPQGDGSRVREELGLEPDELLIVAVGNLYSVKGHATLIRALRRIAEQRPALAWRAAIAGRGEEEEALTALIAESGLLGKIHLLGYRADIADILAAGNLFVMPSLSEGLPLALLEAMFASKPVIASHVGGIPEVVRSGEEALLVPPGDPDALADALDSALCDSDLRARLASAARDRAQTRYTVQAMTDAYEELYVRAVR